MTKNNIEQLQILAEQLNIPIKVCNYDVNRFSVAIGAYSYTNFNKALSAIGTIYRKGKHKCVEQN